MKVSGLESWSRNGDVDDDRGEVECWIKRTWSWEETVALLKDQLVIIHKPRASDIFVICMTNPTPQKIVKITGFVKVCFIFACYKAFFI